MCVKTKKETEIEMWEINPGEWVIPPRFDEDGTPVHLLSKAVNLERASAPYAGFGSKRDVLIDAVASSGVKRRARKRRTTWENV